MKEYKVILKNESCLKKTPMMRARMFKTFPEAKKIEHHF